MSIYVPSQVYQPATSEQGHVRPQSGPPKEKWMETVASFVSVRERHPRKTRPLRAGVVPDRQPYSVLD